MNRQASSSVTGVLFLVGISAAVAWAQEKAAAPTNPQSPPVAVLVNGEPIYVAEQAAAYNAATQQQRIDPAQANRVMAEVLDQLVNRRLVMQALEQDGSIVDPKELEAHFEKARLQLQDQQRMPLEKYAQLRGVTVEALRRELFWRLAWDRYLERHLADALEGHFNKHKKELDGTEVRASHILLRRERYSESPDQTEARARKIREEIESGKISFEDAAKKYSSGPSRASGGDLGFFPRRGVMLDEFAVAAFALEKGALSEPLTTVFGTHLIRVTDIKPGTRQWTEVIPQIKTLASTEMFSEISVSARKKAKIEFSGLTPYYQPDTKQLVVPPAPQQATGQ